MVKQDLLDKASISPVNILLFSCWTWLTYRDPHQKQTEKDFGQHFADDLWCSVLTSLLKYNIAIQHLFSLFSLCSNPKCLLAVGKKVLQWLCMKKKKIVFVFIIIQ